MENADISYEFEKAVMNYFIEHVVFSTDITAFMSFVKTFREATNADNAIIRDELKNRIRIRAENLWKWVLIYMAKVQPHDLESDLEGH